MNITQVSIENYKIFKNQTVFNFKENCTSLVGENGSGKTSVLEAINLATSFYFAVNKNRIKSAIEVKLLTEPEIFGVPLRKSLKGYRKLRVGDYRVIFSIERKTIKIFAIQHRSVIYKQVTKRSKSK